MFCIIMGNESVFNALSSQTRIRIIKLLLKGDMHISGIARELGIAAPVILRHIRILEDAGLIERKVIGNVHLLSLRTDKMDHLMEPLIESVQVEIDKKDCLDQALRQLPFVSLQKHGDDEFIYLVDGKKGYFLYEVDGENPEVPVNAYHPDHDVTVTLSKLVSVKQKKIFVKIKK
jgi:DNA-binding transcriptional ArsR family regulator